MIAAKQKVVWSEEAKQELKAAWKYIWKDSLKNADKVRRPLSLYPKAAYPSGTTRTR
jgi:hypothetical protein